MWKRFVRHATKFFILIYTLKKRVRFFVQENVYVIKRNLKKDIKCDWVLSLLKRLGLILILKKQDLEPVKNLFLQKDSFHGTKDWILEVQNIYLKEFHGYQNIGDGKMLSS